MVRVNSIASFTYDADGNMTGDGRFAYTGNDENSMASASNAEVVVTYAYDHKGRMIRKTISRGDAEPQSMEYLWDGWNIIRETRVTGLASHVSGLVSNVTYNLWGLDIDGTMQGAGGVGGLLAVVRDGEAYLPTYDANGNISEYIDSSDGTIAAHYDYSPFGETLVASGPLASVFTHRFSTKPYCQTTGFCEYQMRKYNPNLGRWMSRDKIKNADLCYVFLHNNAMSKCDFLGFSEVADWISDIYFTDWWWQLAIWDDDSVRKYDDGSKGDMAKRTNLQMTNYYTDLLEKDGLLAKANQCWKHYTVNSGKTGRSWYIVRNGGIDFSDIGFWLNEGQVDCNGGSFEYRINPESNKLEFQHVKTSFTWIDRIDCNPSMNDGFWFFLAEWLDSLCEAITGCDFPVEIKWSDER